MSKYITIRVEIPEDHEDVHPTLVFEDFLENPKAFEAFLISENEDKK